MSLANRTIATSPNFWSGEKAELIKGNIKSEAWLNFNNNTVTITRVWTSLDGKFQPNIYSDIFYGNFSVIDGEFQGGTVTKMAYIDTEPSRGQKNQKWVVLDLKRPFKIQKKVEDFNRMTTYERQREAQNMLELKQTAIDPNVPEHVNEWHTIEDKTPGDSSDKVTFPDRYDNWSEAKGKLMAMSFPETFLDEYYGYTEHFKELDIYDNIKYSEASVSDPSKAATTITAPSKFNKKSADKITNFNPSTVALEIDTDSFGIDSSATFASGKNKKVVKKKLSKQAFEFLYDEKKGGLYFNENGSDKDFGDGGIIAILKGAPDLTSDNLEFI